MNIEQRLREIILLKNNSLKEFSEKADIPYITLQQYLAGNRKPGMDALIKIGIQLNISIDWLLTGEGEMYRKKTIETVENVETSEKTIEWLNEWWENADKKHKIWLEVQMQRCFPEYAAWLEEKKKEKN
jgi:transcriptional regulator with XRE-family HTH domain